MKRLSKEELKKEALRLAKAHKADVVYATEDGNYFLPADKSLAIDHNAKVVKRQEGFEDAEVQEIKVEVEKKPAKEKQAAPPPPPPPPATEKTEAELIADCKAKAIELSEGKEIDAAELRKALKKEFKVAIIDAVLNELTTHE